MSETLEVVPVSRPVQGSIRPPGSKSLTNRALIVAALADHESDSATRLTGVLDSDDTRVMIDSLRRLGHQVEQDHDAGTIELRPAAFDGGSNSGGGGALRSRSPRSADPESNAGGFRSRGAPPPPGDSSTDVIELWLENSGTSIRFLTALAALDKQRTIRLDGNARMRERPIQPLVDALNDWGSDVTCEAGTGCPPVLVKGRGLPGARLAVAGNLSSQYLSALLMAAPCAGGDVTVAVEGELVSRPYVDMTIALMKDFGAIVSEWEENVFHVSATGYLGREYDIEPDASAASYFFAVAAVTGGTVTVEGLHRKALQGDVQFAAVLEQMGCRVEWNERSITVQGGPLKGIDIDMNAISDTAQTLAAVAPFAEGPTTIRGVPHMRHKETDRVSAVVTELRRLGLTVEEHPDGMTIHPGPMHPATIHTYDDHRMAMSFAVLGLRQPGVTIADPGCTSKTYPRFFDDLERLCGAAR